MHTTSGARHARDRFRSARDPRPRSVVGARTRRLRPRSAAGVSRRRLHDADDDARSAVPQGHAVANKSGRAFYYHRSSRNDCSRSWQARRSHLLPGDPASCGRSCRCSSTPSATRRALARRARSAGAGAARRAERQGTAMSRPMLILAVALAAYAAAQRRCARSWSRWRGVPGCSASATPSSVIRARRLLWLRASPSLWRRHTSRSASSLPAFAIFEPDADPKRSARWSSSWRWSASRSQIARRRWRSRWQPRLRTRASRARGCGRHAARRRSAGRRARVCDRFARADRGAGRRVLARS